MNVVNGFGLLLITCFSIEFGTAQTPNRMRGIMAGLCLATTTFGVLVNYTDCSTPSLPDSHSQLCVLLLPGTITTHAVDTSSVCCSCQVLQAEREGQTHQHTCHSGRTL